MQKWNEPQMKKQINYLTNILLDNPNNAMAKHDLEILKELLRSFKFEKSIEYTVEDDKEDIKQIKEYKNIISKLYELANKNEDIDENIEFKKINHTEEYIVNFTKNLLEFISPKWYSEIISNNTTSINFTNSNYVCYLPYIDKFYVSLSKDNTINDLFYSIHEFSHIYTYKLNPNIDKKIEKEFLSILSELILAHEMKKRNFHKEEVIKYEFDNFIQLLNYVNIYVLRKHISNYDIKEKEKIKIIEELSDLNKKDIKQIYKDSIIYFYSYIISYLIAIELFYIYLEDEKKCFKICDDILKNNDLENTLNTNNINLLENTDNYIKTLKKKILTNTF
ncbi:MAG: hypothetical protein IJD92_04800 [Bacilli bacterium]|nr:hypothetical protein [Bacilli bacterium]